MSYQALYRVWRPQRFSDLVGQDAVAKTLKNAIRHQQTSHAYLFTGPRGTGKTSAAKIFAKAINCPKQEDGEPCNTCELCQAITQGSLADVIEIDAASNNGVEEIRDIRDKARYAPTEATYKVYIIDEVHMLSQGAFNALLKTLEEPPENVIFILATTEPHKIPATIISRTQRFNFKRLDTADIEKHLEKILKEEGLKAEDEALHIIARTANGGMRDALSLLDQVLSFSEGKIAAETARTITGSLNEDQLTAYIKAVHEEDVEAALATLEGMLAAGGEPHRFLEELLFFLRDLYLAKMLGADADVWSRPYPDAFFTLSAALTREELNGMQELVLERMSDLRFASQPQIILDLLTMQLAASHFKASQAPKEKEAEAAWHMQVKQLQAEVAALKKAVKEGPVASEPTQPLPQAASRPKARGQVAEFEPRYHLIFKTLQAATNTDRRQIEAVWPDIIASLPTVQAALLQQTFPAAASPEYFVLRFDYDLLCQKVADDRTLQQTVQEKIEAWTDHPGKMLLLTTEQWEKARARYVKAMKAGQLSSLLGDSKAEPENNDQDESVLKNTAQDKDEGNEAVKMAEEIFGKDNISIIDDDETVE